MHEGFDDAPDVIGGGIGGIQFNGFGEVGEGAGQVVGVLFGEAAFEEVVGGLLANRDSWQGQRRQKAENNAKTQFGLHGLSFTFLFISSATRRDARLYRLL